MTLSIDTTDILMWKGKVTFHYWWLVKENLNLHYPVKSDQQGNHSTNKIRFSRYYLFMFEFTCVCVHTNIHRRNMHIHLDTHTNTHKHPHISLVIIIKRDYQIQSVGNGNVQVMVTGGVEVGWKGVGDVIYCNWNYQNETSLKYLSPKLWLFLIV